LEVFGRSTFPDGKCAGVMILRFQFAVIVGDGPGRDLCGTQRIAPLGGRCTCPAVDRGDKNETPAAADSL
jgi:hypothetical protein